MNIFFVCLFAILIYVWFSAQNNKLFDNYKRSKNLLRENLDDFRRREAFLNDARAYYNFPNLGAADEIKNEMIISNELNALTSNQINQHVKTDTITNVSNNYHLPKQVEEDDSVDRIERKILNIFANSESGASIVDIITETRAPRIKIMPVLEQLQKDELIIVANNNDGTVVYKLY